MEITGHTVELLEDPFGLLKGERYEFFLNLLVDEEDELYTENGIMLKVILSVDKEEAKILQYYFIERSTEKVLDFALEEEEEDFVTNYCKNNLATAHTEE
ncbi:DUF6509 family protein [Mesobacillus maritimus]|uniref:DUF6509 family protein n=1 Tax=Mesobacillus maritimus TaxID=1643336 RepID=UPI00203C93B9|nr:DUF6509 family protein [Mesobacillus maritimus]MCM3588055.1 DUF6509 family protein [Mesobacillus maritimus]MCM3668386.1 DUF6509 family protein [Mesobacillus maritimus]